MTKQTTKRRGSKHIRSSKKRTGKNRSRSTTTCRTSKRRIHGNRSRKSELANNKIVRGNPRFYTELATLLPSIYSFNYSDNSLYPYAYPYTYPYPYFHEFHQQPQQQPLQPQRFQPQQQPQRFQPQQQPQRFQPQQPQWFQSQQTPQQFQPQQTPQQFQSQQPQWFPQQPQQFQPQQQQSQQSTSSTSSAAALRSSDELSSPNSLSTTETIFDEQKNIYPQPDNEEQLNQQIQEIFASIHSNPNPNTIIHDPLKNSDLLTLEGRNWINDEVVNFYCSMLNEKSGTPGFNKVFCYNTFLYTSLVNTFTNKSLTSITEIHKSIGHQKPKNLFDNEKILFPIHLNGNHWACISANIVFDDDNTLVNLHYYDSLPVSEQQMLTRLNIIEKFLELEVEMRKTNGYNKRKTDSKPEDIKPLKIEFPQFRKGKGIESNNPHQKNGYDCGVFMILCLRSEAMSIQNPFYYEYKNVEQKIIPKFRKLIALELYNKKFLPIVFN